MAVRDKKEGAWSGRVNKKKKKEVGDESSGVGFEFRNVREIDAVDAVLGDLDVSSIPKLMVWNKVDQAYNPEKLLSGAKERGSVVCLSALTGEGLGEFCDAVPKKLKDSMVWIETLVPFDEGELLSAIHQVGMVEWTELTGKGTMIKAYVPLRVSRLLTPMRQLCIS